MTWLLHFTEDENWGDALKFHTKKEAVEFGEKHFNALYQDETGEEFDDDGTKYFYVGEEAEFLPHIDADMIIEQIIEDAWDKVGGFADGYMNSATKNKTEELEDKLNEDLNNWITKYKLKPSFFTIENVEKIEL